MRSTIIGFLIGLGIIVLGIVLSVRIFGGHPNKETAKPIDLSSYSTTDTVMRLTIDGPTVANDKHQQLRITVGRSQVLYERYVGYQSQVVDTKSYPNNSDSYAQFLQSLSVAGYANGDTRVTKDERGFCPNGKRYIYEAIGDGQDILRWWATSCGGTHSFKGKNDAVRRLFTDQVVDYHTLTRKTVFN